MIRSFFILGCLFLISCSSSEPTEVISADLTSSPTESELSEAMIGTWEIMEMRVKAPTYLGLDSTFTQHITEADWNQVYGLKPARTVYTNDGKLKRTLFLRNGQITDVVNGLWRVKGDTLQVIEPNITMNYIPTLEGEKMKLKGIIDYDRDGEADDTYEANYRLVARTVD